KAAGDLRRCPKIPSTDPDTSPLRAASACTNAKTPAPAFPLVTGSGTHLHSVPPAGFEPAHTAPEAVALSPELRGRVVRVVIAATGRTLPVPQGWSGTRF